MKARDLAEQLMRYPELRVMLMDLDGGGESAPIEITQSIYQTVHVAAGEAVLVLWTKKPEQL